MLEIVALYFLCREMGRLLRSKGWKPLWMQIAVVAGWFGSMVFAGMCYGVYVAIAKGPEAAENIGFAAYPWMLIGAILSQLTLFGIAWLLRDRTPPPLPDSAF